MIHRVQETHEIPDLGPKTHLWKVASMSKWHIAHRTNSGVKAPCGAGEIDSISTLAWRGGLFVSLADIEAREIIWPEVCGRCAEMLD